MFLELLLIGFSACFLFVLGVLLAAGAEALGVNDDTLCCWIDRVASVIERAASM